MAKNSEIDMTKGNPYSLIIKFSIPLLIGNVFQALYNTVDSIVVGNFVGDKALAAVGAGFPFLMVMVSFFIGLGAATTVIVANFYGGKDYDNLNITVGTVYKASIVVIIPMTIIGILGADFVLELLKVPKDGTFEMTSIYIKTLFFGIAGNVGYNTNTGILQGLGDSKTSLKFLVIASVTNIILDLLFVVPFGMGVFGAALATIISQMLSFVLGVLYINKNYSYINIKFFGLQFDKNIFSRLMKLGIPSSIQSITFSLGAMVLYSLLNSFGSLYMAGFTAANKIDTFVFFPIQSISNGVTTYMGQNIGAKKLSRVKEGVKASLVISLVVAFVTSFVLYLLREKSMYLFTDDIRVVKAGLEYLDTVLPFYFLLSILFCYNGILRGLEEGFIPMMSTILGLIVMRVPFAYYFASHFGREYLFYSYVAGWMLSLTWSVGYFYLVKRKKVLGKDERNRENKD